MEFRVLGPIEVRHGERVEVVSGRLQRILLGMLLARPNQPVAVDVLTDALWGERPDPRSAQKLQLHVHRLRGMLDDPKRLSLDTSGYQLRSVPGEVDAERFEAVVGTALGIVAEQPQRAVEMLRGVLSLWRGSPFADLDVPVLAHWAQRLAERRLTAIEALYQAELACGLNAAIIGELTDMAREHPLRERLHGLLMTALYRAGRPTEALAAYRTAREILVNELGVEPGPQLRELQRRMLDGEPLEPGARPVTPSQIPPRPGAFFGRDRELAELDRALAHPDATALVLISGMAGIGKTSLAVRYAHGIADRFSDGRLYLDLRGHSPEPALNPIEALERLIRGLGVEQGSTPTTVDEATARYRSLVAGRKLLVLLDNAASAEQVRPLLPAAPGCLTLVTSRGRLSGLVAREGAHRIELGVLPFDDAHALLVRLLGAHRVDAEPERTSALIEACAGLPLALRIAAAQLADEPWRSVGDYVTELREHGLAVLALDDDQHAAVASAFDLSYQRLDAAAQRLFRLLGLVPGLDVTVDAAAAMCRWGVSKTRGSVRSLTGAHLLEEHAPGRYRFHDLVRDYARQRAGAEESAEARTEALDRLCTWYYRGKSAAAARLIPWRLEPPHASLPGDVPEVSFASEREATAWLEAEFDNIVAAARASVANGLVHWAWHLALGAIADMQRRGHTTEVLAILQEAADAARAAEDRAAIAVTLAELSNIRTTCGLPVPDELAHDMLASAAATEDRSIHGYCLYMAGVLWERKGLLDRAAQCLEQALASQVAGRETNRQALTLLHLGNVTYRQGDLRRSADVLGRLLDLSEELPPTVTAPALANLSHVLLTLGRLDDVPRLLDRAEQLLKELDDPGKYCVLAYTRGGWYRDTARWDDALEQLMLARSLADEVKSPRLRSHVRNELGFCHLARGDVASARTEFEGSVRDASAPGLHQYRSHAMRGLALCDLAQSAPESAQSRAREAIALAAGTERQHEAEALVVLARVELALGRPAEAIARAEQGLAIHRATGHHLGQARAHRVLGEAKPTGSGREHLREALRMLQDYGSPEASEVENLLHA
ncbi:AfsR/SARP family transcriptional regulator [Allorhizocola rhizosphaerae]|uniref:AfsR/SARP family transcriptional regulator n=1 Tax=Allorhizocola rhizosphaerae TaxID=1872709 RepID=UPI000E3DC9CD|nr:BTAD domain-containing putative transcriptional regulator [Allorhizocola rhizosphaerae]